MSKTPTLAIDAMGGDFGPPVVFEAAERARVRHPDFKMRFYGRGPEMQAELARYPKLAAVATLIHTDDVVLGTDKPSQALRRARSSSMGMAIQAVKDGEAQAALSAGNTGALMAIAKFSLRTQPGIDRPALASLFPTLRAESVMLDLGANVECSARNLVEFAIMGAAFARTVLGTARPRVALLNIGVEELKGTEELKDAAAVLREQAFAFDFVGFTEGDKITSGDIDVIVSDGFTGNVALKTAEGTARLIAGLMGDAFRQTLWSKIGYLFARTSLRALRDHLNPNNHNGAVFLGLNGLVVKSHGSADVEGFTTAIGTCRDLIIDGTLERIATDVAQHSALMVPDGDQPAQVAVPK
jgi:phosphate acyltransferase